MTEVIMPKMGDGMEEGTLLEWLKKDGEPVKSGDVIGTIQTDKATMELEAPASGTLSGILVKEGQTVPVGVPIAVLLKDGESLPAGWGGAGNGSAPSAGVTSTPSPVSPAIVQQIAEAPVRAGRIKASPLARKIAEENGIDLEIVPGSGPGGRIVEKDVVAYLESRRGGVPSSSAGMPLRTGTSLPSPALKPTPEDQVVPLSHLRRVIAERTQQSKMSAPHFYVTVEVDVERLHALRKQFEDEASGKVSVNDFVVRACVRALQDMPEVNASFLGDSILRHGAVHIGIAAAIDDGLLVPVIKNAHNLTLREITVKAKELVIKARDGKLMPDEMSGSTFSISNMGMLDVDDFAAIINQPNSGILAVATARKKAVVNERDEIEIRLRMNITGSFDHRVLDGAIGAKFMNTVKAYLENPTRLLT